MIRNINCIVLGQGDIKADFVVADGAAHVVFQDAKALSIAGITFLGLAEIDRMIASLKAMRNDLAHELG